jgi:hypothetical protein
MHNGGIQIIILFFSVCFNISMHAQSEGDYQTKATGNWNQLGTWERFDGTNWVAASATPTASNAGVISILEDQVVTITEAVTIDQVVVNFGGKVIHSGAVTVTLADGLGTDLLIYGEWERTISTNTIFVSSGATIEVGSTGKYIHNAFGGTIPNATWHQNSTLQIDQSVESNQFSDKTYGNVIINNNSGVTMLSSNISDGFATIKGNLIINSSGNVIMSNQCFFSSILTIEGDFLINNSTGNFYIESVGICPGNVTKRVLVNGNFNLISGTLDLGFNTSGQISPNTRKGILEIKGDFLHTGGKITENATDPDYIAQILLSRTSGIQNIESIGSTTGIIEFNVAGSGAQCIVPVNKIFELSGQQPTFRVANGSQAIDMNILGVFRLTGANPIITTGVLHCDSGGVYQNDRSNVSIPNITWADGSLLNVTAGGITGGLNQNFYNVTYNTDAATTNVNTSDFFVRNILSLASTNTGTFTLNNTSTARTNTIASINIEGGTFNMTTSTGTSGLTGSVNVSGGTFNMASGTGAPTITGDVNVSGGNFYAVAAGTGAVTSTINGNAIISGGTFYITGNTAVIAHILDVNGNLELNNTGVIEFNPIAAASGMGRLYVSGDVTISGGTMQRTQTGASGSTGIYFDGTDQTFTWSGGSLAGAVPNRFYTNGVTSINEIYSSSTAQNTVNGTAGTPAVGSAWPTTGDVIKNLTIDNAEGVTLSTAKTVNNTLALAKGVLNLPNALTLADDAHLIRSTGSLSAAPTFGGVVNVTYTENETATTTGPELPVNTSTLKNLTVNSEVILNAAVSVNGNLLLNATLNLNSKTITCSHNITTSTASRIVGTGTLGGGVTLTNNGTIAPGNSIGTITVDGNYTATGDAKHEFEIDGEENDKLIVTGTATLAGSLTVTDITEEEDSTLETYTFIFSEGGPVQGSFDTITIPERFVVNSNETGIFQLVLPVELISFTAREKPQGVWLQWSTASEQDSDYFQIERSSDGKTWEPLGRVVAAGQSNVVRNYEFLDKTPLFGWQYYRLLQKDWDGTSAYYGPVSLFSNAAAGSLEVYPTVFVDQLNLKMQARGQQSIQFTIRNAMGQVLEQGFLATNGQETTLETGAWPAGGYFVQIYTAQKTLKTLKIFKI